MKAIRTILIFSPTILFAACWLWLAGCGTLDKTGPYAGNTFLYQADSTVNTAYNAVDVFLKSDLANRSGEPVSVQQAADKIRATAPAVFKSYYSLRAAYVANETAGSQTTLQAAVNDVSAILTVLNSVSTPTSPPSP